MQILYRKVCLTPEKKKVYGFKSIVRRKGFALKVDERGKIISGKGEWYPCMSLGGLIHLWALSLVQNPEEPKGAEWVNLQAYRVHAIKCPGDLR